PPYWKTWWFITVMSFLTFSIFYIIYKIRINEINKRNNLEKKLLKEVNKFRQKALSQQMNPHFIFNTLNSIQYYILNNDIDSSTQYLSKFSKLMRLILENSQYDTIPIQDELDAMDLYLQLESLRIVGNFKFEIIVNNKVNTKFYKIYPLLIQPYVENSIWHGLIQKGDKKIKIEILPNNDSILCIIEDNGIGSERAMEIKKQQHVTHKSQGTEITSKRIEIINKLYNRDFKVEFIDLKDNTGNAIGTRVLLKIPKIID
ncbi:MAG: histidine kinase, partial [Bacteroidales bacterium]|nr:histidine kinase [Bacteroidales bacterium]